MEKISQRLKQVVSSSRKPVLDDSDTQQNHLLSSPSRLGDDLDTDELTSDPQVIAETIKTIEEGYFSPTIDPVVYEIEKLGANVDLAAIRRRCQQLDKQNRTVHRRVSQLVLEKQPAYETEMHRVLQLQHSNAQALRQCRFVRESLMIANQGLIRSRMQVIANFRRRKKLQDVLQFLGRIQTLQKTVFRLKDLIEAEDYFSALELLRECQEVVQDYRRFECVNKLNTRLKSIQMQINEGLDRGLYAICENFDSNTYKALHRAFNLLQSSQSSINQLQMHFTTALHRRASKIVLGFAQLSNSAANAGGSKQNQETMAYVEVCKMLSPDLLIPCLAALCKGLWQVLHCYHQTTLWHRENAEHDHSTANVTNADNNVCDYALSKLEDGRDRMWSDVMDKVLPIVHAMDQATFKFDEVLRVLLLVNRLVHIGEDFAHCQSEPLQEALRDQMIGFFARFHKENLERLKMFLEHEGWEICVVKSTFSILDLAEYRPFRKELARLLKTGNSSKKPLLDFNVANSHDAFVKPGNGLTSNDSALNDSSSSPSSSVVNSSKAQGLLSDNIQFFSERCHQSPPKNPFDMANLDENVTAEDFMEEELEQDPNAARPDVTRLGGGNGGSESEDEDSPQRRESFHEKSKRESRLLHHRGVHSNRPLVANTTLELCRLIGRYLQIMYLLKPISMEVTKGVCQLFEYYCYSIYSLFVYHKLDSVKHLVTPRLQNCLRRIEDRFVSQPLENTGAMWTEKGDKIVVPSNSHIFQHTNATPNSSQQLTAEIAIRVVAMESLVYVGELLYSHLVPYIRDTILTSNPHTSSSGSGAAADGGGSSNNTTSGQTITNTSSTTSSLSSHESQAKALLHLFNQESLLAAWELRPVNYQVASLSMLSYERIPQRMLTVNWNTKDISSHCSQYVLEINQMLDGVSQCIHDLYLAHWVRPPATTVDLLWTLVLSNVARWWVEGLSLVTNCSQEGRALMLMDLQHYLLKAETLCKTRPIPGKELIEQYIKAFYVPQRDMEEWIQSRKQTYTRRQFISLVNCVVREKKLRLYLLQVLQQMNAANFQPDSLYNRS